MRYLFSLFVVALCAGCGMCNRTITYTPVDRGDSLTIHEGILCTTAQRIRYKPMTKTSAEASIILSEPVMVTMAEQEEEWGFYQFPKIGIADDGTLIVSWSMKKDTPKTYGLASSRQATPMMSKDGGKTWRPQDRKYEITFRGYNLTMSDGSFIQVKNPQSKDIKSYSSFPKPVSRRGKQSFYLVEDLPEDLQGVYFSFSEPGAKRELIHSTLNDNGLLRYAINGLMPISWWGNIKQMADQSLVAGVYHCYYLENNGEVSPNTVSFYRSTDKGLSWDFVGKIPSLSWDILDGFNGDGGYAEPTFEILKDSTFVCVMRTGSSSPMFQSFSYDKGRSWTDPKPIAPNGVKPQLLLLKSGVLVLASGRPGIQLRFSMDGTGQEWTDPIDMIPFMNEDGAYTRDVSCGYASIIEAGDDSFYLVYSDFTTKNEKAEGRKSIWFRKVTVK